jgi:hypothetical protein
MHRDGAIHCLSYLIYRDWVVTLDVQANQITDDPEKRWSASKLNKNEFMLLFGVLIQAASCRTYTEFPSDAAATIEEIDRLLREFHDGLLTDMRTRTCGRSTSTRGAPERLAKLISRILAVTVKVPLDLSCDGTHCICRYRRRRPSLWLHQ